MTYHVLKSHKEKAAIAEQILNSNGKISVEVKRLGTRSAAQNASLHLCCQWIADALNDSGLSVRQVLREDVDVPWTMIRVKELIWRTVQQAMIGKESTTRMNKLEPSDIYDVLMRHLGEKHGIYVPWPSVETMKDE